MKPSDFQKTVQCRFESCLKKVVRHVVKDYQQKLKRRQEKETLFCELPEIVVENMAVLDDYETDYTIFNVCGHDIRVYDDELAEALDNEFNLYSFMPRMYSFYTNIKADYLIASHVVIDSFVFLIHTSPNGDAKCDFLCCSTFAKGDRDYEQNQKKRTLLKKERIHIPSNITTVLLNKLDNESS